MLKALKTGTSGMLAQTKRLDVIGQNLANIATPSYKRQQVIFSQLVSPGTGAGERIMKEGENVAMSGCGSKAYSISAVHQGQSLETGRRLDIAIEGSGYLKVQDEKGNYSYTRDGRLQLNSAGRLCTLNGDLLVPEVAVPGGYKDVSIDPGGTVVVTDGDNNTRQAGRITLYSFKNPAGLNSLGGGLFMPTEQSGQVTEAMPGQDGLGTLRPGTLEQSNVNLLEELAGLAETQHAYQINAQAVRTSDELWNLTNNIKK